MIVTACGPNLADIAALGISLSSLGQDSNAGVVGLWGWKYSSGILGRSLTK